MKVTRRGLFVRGLLGGVLLAVGGGSFLALRGTRMVPAPDGLKVLDPQRYSVLVAVVARLLPDPVAAPAARDAVPLRLDEVLAASSRRVQKEMVQLLGLFENALAGFLLDGTATPFTHRSAAAQDETLARWQQSRLALRRTGYQAMKRLVYAAYYSDPAAWGDAAYPGPPSLPGAPG